MGWQAGRTLFGYAATPATGTEVVRLHLAATEEGAATRARAMLVHLGRRREVSVYRLRITHHTPPPGERPVVIVAVLARLGRSPVVAAELIRR